jgi:Glycosyl transferases group 1
MRVLLMSSAKPLAWSHHFIRAFRRCGHETVVLSDIPADGVDVLARGAVDIARLCDHIGFRPDFFFNIEGGSGLFLPIGLENLECPTAWYSVDCHADWHKHLSTSRLHDVVFVAQKEYVEPLRANGIVNAEWLPVACPADFLPSTPQERTIDLAFVGSLYDKAFPERVRNLNALCEIAASQEVGPCSPREMMERYSRARVVFNMSIKNDLNLRYFEAMGAGAVLLTNKICNNGVEDLFTAGLDLVEHTTTDDLLSIYRSLINDPARIAEIGARAQALILAKHTYDHRVNSIVERMARTAKVLKPRAYDYFAMFVAHNMLPEALTEVSKEMAVMGVGSHRRPLTLLAGAGISTMNFPLSLATRLVRRVHYARWG